MAKTIQLPPDRIREIAEIAGFIGVEYAIGAKVSPKEIAWKNNISFSYGNYRESFDGLLQYYNNHFHIFINLDSILDSSYPRARFTFAHELGHYFLDEHRNSLSSGRSLFHPSKAEYQSDLIVEKEADTFASFLLMPNEWFEKRVKFWSVHSGLQLVQKISNSFGTSLTSTAIRMAQENVLYCGVIKWGTDGTLSWYWLSDDFYELQLGSCKPHINSVGIESASYKALNQTHQYREDGTGIYSAKCSLSAFFPFASGTNNKKIREDAIKLGAFGYLTFLVKS